MQQYLDRLREYAARALDAARDMVDDLVARVREWRDRRRERAERDHQAEADREPRRSLRRDLAGDAAVVVATADDDVASVVGRIDTADTLEVVLVVRRDARALRRATAWPHIAAHTRRRGIILGVVSPRGDVRSYARENGLRTARNPGGLRPDGYYLRVGGRDIAVPPVPWGKIVRGSMILVFLGVVTIVGCYQVPSAQIRLVPASQEFTASGEARANAIVDVADVETQTITANTIRRQVITAVTTSTTGQVEVGDAHATLTVRFGNGGDAPIDVPGGTRVTDGEGTVFLTDEPVQVPGQGEADITATAEFPGEHGNVAAGLLTVAEDVPEAISVSNVSAGTGGTNRLTAGVTQEDVDRVREIADGVLTRIATSALELAVDEEELGTLLPSSVTAAVFGERPLQLLEEASDILVVEYTIIAAGLVVTPGQAAEYGELLLRESLPDGQALLPGSVVAEVMEPADAGGRVVVDATGLIASLSPIAAIADRLTGMSPGDASALLQDELSLEEAPVIDIRPNFIPWMWLPRRAENIEIVVAGPTTEEADPEDAEGAAGEEDEDAEESPADLEPVDTDGGTAAQPSTDAAG